MDTASSSVAASCKALQESASALYRRSITPLLQRCGSYMGDLHYQHQQETLDVEIKRSLQQTENLKWQQDMFHRVLKLICLFNEGLVSHTEVQACKLHVIQHLKSLHQDGEWSEFTRDKLLFLQDLLFAACISEEEYHDAKKPLILRLADQGAIIDAQDFIFGAGVTNNPKKVARTPKKTKAQQAIAAGDASSPVVADDMKNSPLKQVMGAVCRRNTPNSKSAKARRVPHALDFLRPENCPVRDPPSPAICQKPIDRESPSPLFRDVRRKDSCTSPEEIKEVNDLENSCSPSVGMAVPVETILRCPDGSPPASVNPLQFKSPSTTLSRFKTLLSGFIPKTQGDTESGLRSPNVANESDSEEHQEERHAQMPHHSDNQPLAGGEGPNTVRLKKKIHSKGAPTDFFIDKVLGENIKNELSRIRAEMNSTQPGQTFTNEQIDAIATRLPVDKSELNKFFPQSWCERYGDVVLEVVKKEFREHVGEMEKLRKAGKGKRGMAKKATVEENDENRESRRAPPPCKLNLNKCFTTVDNDDDDSTTTLLQSPNKPKKHTAVRRNLSTGMEFHHDFEDTLRMPFRKVNEYGSHLRP